MTVAGVYSPEQAAMQAHVDKVIASDGVGEDVKLERMRQAMIHADIGEGHSFRDVMVLLSDVADIKWDEPAFVRQTQAMALGALRALEGE